MLLPHNTIQTLHKKLTTTFPILARCPQPLELGTAVRDRTCTRAVRGLSEASDRVADRASWN
eukprot:10036324-Lingulodinium_polyedra.AAC.1